MAGSIGGVAGGIHGLLDELDRHGEAIEHDLVRSGWTLDDVPDRLSWRALRSFVRHASQDRTTALHRVVVGDDAAWGLTEQLLAATVDALAVANWQRASGGKSKPKKPKPIPRPGVGRKVKTGGFTPVPLSEARRIFRAHNPAAFADG